MNYDVDLDSFNSVSVESTLPTFIVSEKCEPFIILKDTLEVGTCPLILEFNGVQKLVQHISMSAYNVKKLLSVFESITYRNNGITTEITSIIEYLEVI